MDLRQTITDGLKDAIRDKDQRRTATLRLVSAAIKDQDIALRAERREAGQSEIMAILSKMVRQRHESAHLYEEGGRLELAARERDEIVVIEEFLPRKLTSSQVSAAIEAAIARTGACSIRDIGKVMAALKAAYPGQMDFGAAGAQVKARLGLTP